MCRKYKTMLAFALAVLMALQPMAAAAKTREEIQQEREQKKNEQKNTQSQYKESQGKLSDLQEEQDVLQEEIDELDSQLVEVLASVSLMEDQIADTETQIEKAQEDYDAAKAQEDAQYQAMKKRIRYLYKKGETSYVEILVKASSWNDMLNQASYVEKLYEYDRQMLERYILIKEEVAQKKNDLEDKKSDLEAQKYELQEEQASMQEMLDEKKAASSDYEVQIAKARQEAATYKALIKQQNAEIAQLDEEENAIIRAEEERRKAEEAARAAAEKAAKEAKEAQEGKKSTDSSGASESSSSKSKETVTASSGGLQSVPPASGSSGSDIAAYACQFVGNPYVSGGTSLTNGADCSGFIWAVYKQYGYSLPRNSTGQRSAGREVSYEEARPGDIICYAGHVALYLGGGRIVHASTARTGIKYGYANYRPILTVRRIVG
ncbi:MAG: NlpC/P60 family protein [Eubacteriales bacterium]|nr:NlpC/P60 family protein [Eubacteriales bacterium]